MLLLSLALTGLVFLNDPLAAQDGIKNSLGVSFGGSNFHVLDEHANQMIFRGTGIAPSLGFYHLNHKNIHIVAGKFYYNNLSSSSDNFRTIILAGNFRYCYLRMLLKSNLPGSQISLSAGVSFNSFFIKSHYEFYRPALWATAIKSWYGSHSGDIAIRLNYLSRVNNRFEVLFFMPVISNVSRPAFSPSGDYNYETNDWDAKAFGKIMTVSENLAFNTYFSFNHNFSSRVGLKAEYEFYYTRCRKPDLLKFYMNNLRIGILYSLNS